MAGHEVDHYVMTECKNGKCLGDDGTIWSAPNVTVFGTLTKYRYLDADGVEQEESVDPHSVICKNGGGGVCIDYATKEGADLMATLIELTNSDTKQHGSDLMAILNEQLEADCFWIRNGYQNIYVCNATVFEPVMAGHEVDHYEICKNGKCIEYGKEQNTDLMAILSEQLGGDSTPWSAPNVAVFGTLTKHRYVNADGVVQEEMVNPHFVMCSNGDCIDYPTKNGNDLMTILIEQLEADRDYGNEHIRGQDWEGEEEGEEERELIVSHGEIMPTVMTATNQWTPSFVVVVGVLTVFAVVMIWRAANIHKKWAKDDYAPISDGSAKTSHMIYV